MENNTNKTLLIIDDDQALVDRLLSLFGGIYDSHVAFTGETGLQLYSKLKKEKPVVICDVNLPDITGFDVCRSIKSEESGTYVMLFTAYNDRELRMSGYEAYADSYVDKIIKDDEIKLKIRNAFNITNPTKNKITYNNTSPVNINHFNFKLHVKECILSFYTEPLSKREGKDCTLRHVYKSLNQSKRTFQRNMEHVGLSFINYRLTVRLERSKAEVTQ